MQGGVEGEEEELGRSHQPPLSKEAPSPIPSWGGLSFPGAHPSPRCCPQACPAGFPQSTELMGISSSPTRSGEWSMEMDVPAGNGTVLLPSSAPSSRLGVLLDASPHSRLRVQRECSFIEH